MRSFFGDLSFPLFRSEKCDYDMSLESKLEWLFVDSSSLLTLFRLPIWKSHHLTAPPLRGWKGSFRWMLCRNHSCSSCIKFCVLYSSCELFVRLRRPDGQRNEPLQSLLWLIHLHEVSLLSVLKWHCQDSSNDDMFSHRPTLPFWNSSAARLHLALG